MLHKMVMDAELQIVIEVMWETVSMILVKVYVSLLYVFQLQCASGSVVIVWMLLLIS